MKIELLLSPLEFNRILALPMYPELTENEQSLILGIIKRELL